MAAPHLSAEVLTQLARLKGRPPADVPPTDVKVETPVGPRSLPPSVQALAAVEWPDGHVVVTRDAHENEARLPRTSEAEAGVFGNEPERAWFAVGVFDYGARWLVDLDEAAGTDDPVVAFDGYGGRAGTFRARPLSQRLTDLKSKRPVPKRYAFARACANGDVDAVKAGIATGASLWPVKAGDPTPLHLAALTSRSPEVVRLLIEAGAGLEIVVDKQPASLHKYTERERFSGVRLLPGGTPLAAALDALTAGTPETVAAVPGIVDVLLAAGANTEARTATGDTMLGKASGTHSAEALGVVERLLAAGADIDPPGGNGPLLAAIKGDVEIVRLLVDAGADPCRSCEYGYVRGTRRPTPLHKAAAAGSPEVLRLLLSTARDVDVLSADGVAPLHCAAAGDDPVRVRLLLEAGADPTVRLATPETFHEGLAGRTPLEIARELGNGEHAAILEAVG